MTKGQTAMRQLQRFSQVSTSYGGRYVDAIDGLAASGGQGFDWLFYVDGVQSDVGAAAWRIKPAQIIQWDYHQWRDITTPEAIVGAYPQPLVTRGVTIVCKPASLGACAHVKQRLKVAGVPLRAVADGRAVRVVVGAWDDILAVHGVPDLTRPAADSGAFASIAGGPAKWRLRALGGERQSSQPLGPGSGLVAAVRVGDVVTWVVTGDNDQGVERAVRALDRVTLKHRFAVVATSDGVAALPLTRGPGR